MCRSYLRNGEYRAVLLGVSRSGAGSGMILLCGFAVRFPAASDSLGQAMQNTFPSWPLIYQKYYTTLSAGLSRGGDICFLFFNISGDKRLLRALPLTISIVYVIIYGVCVPAKGEEKASRRSSKNIRAYKERTMKADWKIMNILRSSCGSVRRNLIACLAVCFVMVFIAGQYGGSTQFIASYDMQNVTNLRVDAAGKREVVEAVINGGLTPEEASDKYNINDPGAVKNWVTTYKEYGENSLNAKELTFFHSGNESSNWALIDETATLISGRQRPMTTFVSENTRRHEQQVSDAFDMVTKEYSPHFQILAGILAFFSDKSAWDIVVTIATSLFSILVAIFVADTLLIGERRFFLENRAYRRTAIGRMGFMFKERFFKPLKTIVLMHVFRGLWFLTVIGGFYKTYEYYMIPFILAENPNIGTKEAFALSKEMMRGSKWKTFLLNASFWMIELPIIVGAVLISLFLMGEDYKFISGIFAYLCLGVARIGFLNAWKTASDAELYITLRRRVIAESCEYSDQLCDHLLDPESLDESREYETNIGRMDVHSIKALDRYPGSDQHGQTEYIGITKKQILIRHDYHRDYRLTSSILIFFSFAFIGWLWEVIIHVIEDGELINRGSLHGPWLPIYGIGGTAAVLCLKKLRDRPAETFLVIVTASGIFEYVTSWYFDRFKDLQYWNYNGYFLNINGRICLEGLVVFGFAGMACIYLFAPVIDDIAAKIPENVKKAVCAGLVAAILCDTVYSFFVPNKGKGITDYAASPVSVVRELDGL